MLQEKKKENCIKGIVIFIILISIFAYFPFLAFVVIFLIIKFDISFSKMTGVLGIKDCFKFLIFEEGNSKKSEKRTKVFDKNSYLEKINKSIKKRAEELKKQKKEKQKNTNIISNNFEEKYKPNKKKKIIKSTGFNNGKSIWDDYESVIDIMNKK